MMIRIADVQALGAHRVRLTLTNGRVGEVDLEPLLQGPVFTEIRRDPRVFRRVTVIEEAGTIAWPNGADLCPDVLIDGLSRPDGEDGAAASGPDA